MPIDRSPSAAVAEGEARCVLGHLWPKADRRLSGDQSGEADARIAATYSIRCASFEITVTETATML
jgi:hypothetical protein